MRNGVQDDAAEEYLPGQEVVAAFLEERCILGSDRTAAGGELYAAFSAWAAIAQGRPISRQGFSQGLAACGLEHYHGNKGKRWRGLELDVHPAAPARPAAEATDPGERSTAA